DARVGPGLLFWRSREGDYVERQGHFADYPFDLAAIGEPGYEEAARPRVGECLAALHDLIDQAVVIGLGLEEQVGPRVDVEVVADRAANRGDALHLEVERMESFTADHLVLEVAADRAGRLEPRDIRSTFLGIRGIGALEVHR